MRIDSNIDPTGSHGIPSASVDCRQRPAVRPGGNRPDRAAATLVHILRPRRGHGDATHRVASPQRLVYYRDQWYLDCWDEGKDALRTFSIDRMRNIEILDDVARNVPEHELDAALTAGYGLFSGPVRHRATLVFTPERARWVADEIWHRDQVGRFRPDSHYELVVPYADPRELVGEILRYGGDVRVVGPQSLAEQVRGHLERAIAQYRG